MKRKYFPVCVLLIFVLSLSGCDKKSGAQNQSTISVFGTGTVLVEPDMIQMNISLRNIAQTTGMASEAVNKMVNQTLEVLKIFNVEDKNISTASLTFNSEYEYENGRRILIGQKAEQRIMFSVDNIQNDNNRVSQIIDRLIQIDGMELNQIDFSVRNNTEFFVKSRELAFQKAVEKANQYAELSGLKVIKLLSLSEEGDQHILPMNNRTVNQFSYLAEASVDTGSTVLPAGELEISTRILAVFLLE